MRLPAFCLVDAMGQISPIFPRNGVFLSFFSARLWTRPLVEVSIHAGYSDSV